MHRTPSLHALRAFEAAARLGSFARAADELALSPSAISHQVRALEEHFGRPMFVRTNRTVILTPEGERLLATLSPAFESIHAVCAELSPPTTKQDLSVHCTPSFAAKWLSPRLPGFMLQHPNINIRISSSADAVDLSRHEELDVIIAYGRAPRGAGLTVRSLGHEEIAALCAPAFAEAHVDAETADFSRMVRLESTFSPVRWSDWFELNGLDVDAAQTGPAFDRGSMVIAAAVQGLGLALETVRFAQAELDAGSLLRFGEDRFQSISRDLHFLCYRTRDEATAKIRHFSDWVLEQSRA
ncbi:MAG: LysR substrate-binding domain-containing protein [Rhodospirillales bacterium]